MSAAHAAQDRVTVWAEETLHPFLAQYGPEDRQGRGGGPRRAA